MFKLVLHISDLDKWPAALNNARNTVEALRTQQRPFKIAVIVNAAAVKGYLDPTTRTQITEISTDNLQFFACNNSLTGQNITPDDLNPQDSTCPIQIVPVAIMALVEYQNAGFAYIKP